LLFQKVIFIHKSPFVLYLKLYQKIWNMIKILTKYYQIQYNIIGLIIETIKDGK